MKRTASVERSEVKRTRSEANFPSAAIEAYLKSNLKWKKTAFLGEALHGIRPLDLLMPLMIARTMGFLKRVHGGTMAVPFDKARIPNCQPFVDRETLETYPKINAKSRLECGTTLFFAPPVELLLCSRSFPRCFHRQ